MTTNVTPNMETQPPELEQNIAPQTAEEQRQLVGPEQAWSDSRAKEVAKRDFETAFSYRVNNYDKSFRKCDEVYQAVTKTKNWEGTKVPRASVPIWMGVQQIESLLPHVMSALFSDDYPFEALPKVGTTFEMARQARDLIRWQCEDLNPDVMGMSIREVVRRAYKSDLIYGVAPVEAGWLNRSYERLNFSREQIPIVRDIVNVDGTMGKLPTGEFTTQLKQEVKNYCISRPQVVVHSVYDVVVDPNCKSHNWLEAGYTAVRELLPISYLKTIVTEEAGFNVPDDNIWLELAEKTKSTMAETGKAWQEVSRGNYYNAGLDQSADPNQKRVEVIRYRQRDRYVWLLGREYLAYNKPNDLGISPIISPFYIDVPGRPYGISLCDVIETDMKLAQAIIESRIDELNLIIHPPIVKTRGVAISQSQMRFRPGAQWEVDDMEQMPKRMEMGNVTANAYVEIQALEQRVQKTTGVTDLAAMGAASTGGNSANRTATGINAQSAATGTRIQYQVENLEDQFIEPLLNILLLLNQKYLSPEENIFITDPQSAEKQVDPLNILNADVRFKLKASNKLRLRRALAGGGLEAVTQFIQNLAAEQLAMDGVEINWQTVGQLVSDAVGLPSNDLFRPIDPQKLQMMQQQKMAPDMTRMQMQSERIAAQSQRADEQDDTKLMLEMMKRLLTPEVVAHMMKEHGIDAPMKMLQAKVTPKPVQGGE